MIVAVEILHKPFIHRTQTEMDGDGGPPTITANGSEFEQNGERQPHTLFTLLNERLAQVEMPTFSDGMKQTLIKAEDEAIALGHTVLLPEHVMLAAYESPEVTEAFDEVRARGFGLIIDIEAGRAELKSRPISQHEGIEPFLNIDPQICGLLWIAAESAQRNKSTTLSPADYYNAANTLPGVSELTGIVQQYGFVGDMGVFPEHQ